MPPSSGAIAETFVQISPDLTKFGPQVEAGIRKAATGAQSAADKAFDGITKSGTRSADQVETRWRDTRGHFVKHTDGMTEAAHRAMGHIAASTDKAANAANKSFANMESTGGRHIGGLSNVVRTVLGGALAYVSGRAVLDFTKSLIVETREANKVSAITEATLKATGNAAGTTAEKINDLAIRISNKTAIDDEQIQSAANQLLTFKSIRNEVGPLNNIFDRATQAAVDLSAHGFGDLSATSIQMGKALENPVKGMTALARSGVTFSDEQKKVIKGLVESGDLLGAQKILLEAVEGQVGGTAEATATAGQRLRVVIANLKERIGKALVPTVDKIATMLATKLPLAIDKAGKWMTSLGKIATPIFRNIQEAVRIVAQAFKDPDITGGPREWQTTIERLGGAARAVFDAFRSAIQRVVDMFKGDPAGGGISKMHGALELLNTVVIALLDFITAHPDVVVGLVTAIAGLLIASKVAGAISGLGGAVVSTVKPLKDMYDGVGKVVEGIGKVKSKAVDLTVRGAEKAKEAIASIADGMSKLKNKTIEITTKTKEAGGKAAGAAKGALAAAGKGIATGIGAALGGALALALGALGSAAVITAALAVLAAAIIAGIVVLLVKFHKPIINFFTKTLPPIVGRFFTQTLPRIIGGAVGVIASALLLNFVGIPLLIVQAFVTQTPRVIAAVVGLVTGITLNLVGVLARFFSSLPGQIIDFFVALPGNIAKIVAAVVDFFLKLPSELPKMAAATVTGILDFFKGLPGEIAGFFASIFRTITETLGNILSAIINSPIGRVIGEVVHNIIEGFRGAWQRVNELTGGALNAVAGVVSTVLGTIVGFITGMPGKIARAAAGMWDGIKDAFRSVINWIIRGWNRLEFKIPGFDPPGPIGKIGGFTLGVPDIPELAAGAIIGSPTLALIGEMSKREVVIPLTDPARALELANKSGLFGVLAKALGAQGRPQSRALGAVGAAVMSGGGIVFESGAINATFPGVTSASEAHAAGVAFGEGLASTLARRQARQAARIA